MYVHTYTQLSNTFWKRYKNCAYCCHVNVGGRCFFKSQIGYLSVLFSKFCQPTLFVLPTHKKFSGCDGSILYFLVAVIITLTPQGCALFSPQLSIQV
jgi:hypothetical protein